MVARKILLLVVGVIVCGSLTTVLVSAGQSEPAQPGGKGAAKAPPALLAPPESLRAYYPPASAKPEYTLHMLELGRLMGYAFQEIYAGSPDAAASLAAFQANYEMITVLVPEWKDYFPQEVVLDLKKAVAAEAPLAELKRATHEVEQVCTRCHTNEVPRVQALYDWPQFAKVTAPVDAKSVISFHDIMIQLSILLAGIPSSAEKGNFEQAGASFTALKKEFDHLETACGTCHEEPREYFVDKRIKGRLSRLGGLIHSKEADPSQYRKEVDEVYARSCIPCHHIHMPPAFTQMLLKYQGVPMP